MSEKIDDFRHFARIGNVTVFYEMASEALSKYLELNRNIEYLKSQGKSSYEEVINNESVDIQFFVKREEINEVEHQVDKELIKIVIFLATFIDSYIWEFAASTLGEKFTKEHLDKLDTLSKWKIMPKLITGKNLRMDSNTIGGFKMLISHRNKFVHFKSKDFITFMGNLQQNPESIVNLSETIDVLSFFKFIKNLFHELDVIDPLGHHVRRVTWYNES